MLWLLDKWTDLDGVANDWLVRGRNWLLADGDDAPPRATGTARIHSEPQSGAHGYGVGRKPSSAAMNASGASTWG